MALVRDAANMALVVAAMDADFGTPRRAAERAGAMALISPENKARRARAARRGTLVRCINKTLEDKDAEDRRSEGRAPAGKGKCRQTWYKRSAL